MSCHTLGRRPCSTAATRAPPRYHETPHLAFHGRREALFPRTPSLRQRSSDLCAPTGFTSSRRPVPPWRPVRGRHVLPRPRSALPPTRDPQNQSDGSRHAASCTATGLHPACTKRARHATGTPRRHRLTHHSGHHTTRSGKFQPTEQILPPTPSIPPHSLLTPITPNSPLLTSTPRTEPPAGIPSALESQYRFLYPVGPAFHIRPASEFPGAVPSIRPETGFEPPKQKPPIARRPHTPATGPAPQQKPRAETSLRRSPRQRYTGTLDPASILPSQSTLPHAGDPLAASSCPVSARLSESLSVSTADAPHAGGSETHGLLPAARIRPRSRPCHPSWHRQQVSQPLLCLSGSAQIRAARRVSAHQHSSLPERRLVHMTLPGLAPVSPCLAQLGRPVQGRGGPSMRSGWVGLGWGSDPAG